MCLSCNVSRDIQIWVRGHSRSFKTAAFDRWSTTSYQSAVVSNSIVYHFRNIWQTNIVTSKSRLGTLTLRIYAQSVHVSMISRPAGWAVLLPLIVWGLHSLPHIELRKKLYRVRCCVTYGRSKSLEVLKIGTNRKRVCDFHNMRTSQIDFPLQIGPIAITFGDYSVDW